jgi:hypothetical protein
MDTSLWENDACVKDWWTKMASGQGEIRKAMASMLMIVPSEVWKERHARVF